VRAEWSPRAVTTASRFLEDADGMRTVVAALDALAADPYPADSFRWGDMFRLRSGRYRIMYVVENDLITIERVDRVSGGGPATRPAAPLGVTGQPGVNLGTSQA
jgi:mRNA-degrading endonuclease RelE of RelBE toxin-antitoxin system